MPFTEENKPLLLEAATIDFQFGKDGRVNYRRHSKREIGLYFIKRAVEIHGNTYGYHKVDYHSGHKPVTLVCSHHGDFYKTPVAHLTPGGCSLCSGKAPLTTDTFISASIKVHGEKYNYEKVNYINKNTKVIITCNKHGDFLQTPDAHKRGNGCPLCKIERCTYTTDDFIAKAREVHGDKYDYSTVVYTHSKDTVSIGCPLHGTFSQPAVNHLRGYGCSKCAGHNHDILYLLKCLDTGWYKIGITNNIRTRILDMRGNLAEIHSVKLADPRSHETILHKRYEKDREYNLCVRNGNTEFFSLTEEQVKEAIDYMNEVSNE